jgi:hypothetical protein
VPGWPAARCYASADSNALADAIVEGTYQSQSPGPAVVAHYCRELKRAVWTESGAPQSDPGTPPGTLCSYRLFGDAPAGLNITVPPAPGAANYTLMAIASRWAEKGGTVIPAHGTAAAIICPGRPSPAPSPT